jgi:hypothetical protein
LLGSKRLKLFSREKARREERGRQKKMEIWRGQRKKMCRDGDDREFARERWRGGCAEREAADRES